MRLASRLILIAFCFYASACLALFLFQRSLIYAPRPAAHDAAGTTLSLRVPDAELVVSTRPHDGRKALIYFGGNAEDVSASLMSFADAFPEYAIYLLHYRGYGGSTGTPNEEALSADALALFDRVHAEHPDIAVIGRSLGSGVATRLASRRPVGRLILVTPFDSVVGIAADLFPYFPVRWILTDRYESSRYAPDIHAPTLVLQAEHDEVIPAASTERLVAAFDRKTIRRVVIPGVGHNDISMSDQYLGQMRSVL